ncbi:MAG: FKBP-type peptidyl-prolyl cis-trans isomerase [Bacteroidetes bacterium]|nr:FKBP-type peptidyl-prolyl cis-trans isomerase [Bacteroidota bacterium]
MKKISAIILVVTAIFISCSKSNNTNQNCSPVSVSVPTSEIDSLTAYLDSNNITATKDARGFFYTIDTIGTGDNPTVCNIVTVNYKGWLTNGTGFDSANVASFYLGQLIAGWQEGIPLIAAGGSMTLYLPPTLGYGSSGYGNVPGNSILIFKIDLLGFR